MIRPAPTREQLAAAWRACGGRGSLDDALSHKALAISLRNVAFCMFHKQPKKAPRFDYKRACAGDIDD